MLDGWKDCVFKDVLEVISGKSQKSVKDPNGAFPIYGSGGIMGRANDFICEPGTTIIGRKGTINNPIFVEERFWNVDTAFGLAPKSVLLPKYLFYFAQSFNFTVLDKSTTVPSLAKRDLLKIKIPLPPLPTQRAIVEKIETLFAHLDRSVADLERARKRVGWYRQAVLDEIFDGSEEVVTLEEVSTAVAGYAFKSNSFLKEGGKYQVLRIGNIRPYRIRFDYSPVYLDEVEDKILKRVTLNRGDVLITLTGTRKKRDYGFTTLVSSDNLLLNQRVAALRFNNSYDPKYFLYYSNSESFKKQFFGSETGNVGQGNVGMKSIRITKVPSIPIKKQRQIVQEIETRFSQCDAVEQTIEQNLRRAAALRQSILRRAFLGELVVE